MQTDDPSQVYTRESLIPSVEWAAIDVSQIITAKDDRGRSGALPWRRSRWIEDKLRVTVEGPKDVRKRNLYVELCLCSSRVRLCFLEAPVPVTPSLRLDTPNHLSPWFNPYLPNPIFLRRRPPTDPPQKTTILPLNPTAIQRFLRPTF